MAKKVQMQKLGEVLDQESYSWLAANHPQILEAVEVEVAAGKSPDEIRFFVLMRTGRVELAARCQAAARHVAAMEV
jgi:hypothetical protein